MQKQICIILEFFKLPTANNKRIIEKWFQKCPGNNALKRFELSNVKLRLGKAMYTITTAKIANIIAVVVFILTSASYTFFSYCNKCE